MTWYKQTLKKYGKEIISGAFFSVLFSLALLIWIFAFNKTFTWTNIEPIEQPSIFVRIFYSALTFITLGAFLYMIGFYKILYQFIGDWGLFKEAKRIIWLLLMGFMFFIVVPVVVDLLNGIISILYNLLGLIVFSFPPIGISLIIFIFYFYAKKQLTNLDLK